jgi:hypothetical protein
MQLSGWCKSGGRYFLPEGKPMFDVGYFPLNTPPAGALLNVVLYDNPHIRKHDASEGPR